MRWDVTVSEAAEIQKELQSKVRLEKLPVPRLIAGVDVSSNRFDSMLYGGFVVMTYPELQVVETACAKQRGTFPYVPGFLSFREIPALLKAFEKLTTKPDVLCVDGQGIAHPRRMGIAAHLGLALDIPSVGFAKSVLYGKGEEPAPKAPAFAHLLDPKTGEIIGACVRTKVRCKPMVVSPGHRATLDDAIKLCLATMRKYRIPEPTRLAHEAVNAFRRAAMKAPQPRLLD
jgi:deoxyribonuclease V